MKSLVSSISLSITAVILFFATNSYSQVGIGTASPEAALDVSSTNAGLLLPRIALTSLTVVAPITNPNGGAVVDGTMIWNTGTGGVTPAGYYYWQNSRWNLVGSDNQPQVYFGKFILTAGGPVTVSGVPFTPRAVEFTAINRVQSFNAGYYTSPAGNSNDVRIAGGTSIGYAQNNGGTISQQVISHGYNGTSINNIGTYASDTHCLAALFVNQDGRLIRDDGNNIGNAAQTSQEGLIRASLTSFNSTGFVLNVDRFLAGAVTGTIDRTNRIVVTYKAYR
ncbi:MAG: hypothetical protein NWQ09_08990 [Nonlabens sp.]|nr:hypothetical protein [Nonlabens sp.]